MSDRLVSPRAVGAPILITLATVRDLGFVVALQKAHGAALVLREKIGLGQMLLARVGGVRAGFLHHGSLARPEVRVFQIAVSTGATGKGVGGALVDDLLERASATGARGVSLRCLAFLNANRFWHKAGFRLHATEPGAKGTLNVWVRRLEAENEPKHGRCTGFAFASRVHPCPCCGAPTVHTWVRGARRLAFCAGCVAAAGLN